jgi:hypothetical protein
MDAKKFTKIIDKLNCLKKMGEELAFFGASQYRYVLSPPLTESAIVKFERWHSITLPDEYHGFLINEGDGGAGPYYRLLPLRTCTGRDVNFAGVIQKAMPLVSQSNISKTRAMILSGDTLLINMITFSTPLIRMVASCYFIKVLEYCESW